MPLRERILSVGPPGSGKTHAWLTIAKAMPSKTFYVLDPDDGVDRVRYQKDVNGKLVFPELKNIKYYFTPTWFGDLKQAGTNDWHGGLSNALRHIAPNVKDGDWIVTEQLGSIWEAAQSGFVGAVFDKGIGDYFLEKRKAMESGAPAPAQGRRGGSKLEALDGWKDWQVINKLHNDDFMNLICFRLPVHVYMTSTYSITDKGLADKEDPELKALYSGTLVRIDGQKHNPFRAQTILVFTGNPKIGFTASTFLKDRGRRWISELKMVNFSVQYLMSVAGLELEAV